jgi:hypothetical protein
MDRGASAVGLAPSGMGLVLAMRVRSTSRLGCSGSAVESMSREQRQCWA